MDKIIPRGSNVIYLSMKRIFQISVLFAISIFTLAYGEVEVSASLKPSRVRIGDTAILTLAVDYPETVDVGFITPKDSMVGGFNILAVSADTVEKYDDKLHREIHYKLIYFDIFDNLIPPLGVSVKYPSDSVDTVFTQPIRVSFVSVLEDAPIESLDIMDIKEPRPVKRNYVKITKNFLIALGIFLLTLIALVLWRLREKGISIMEFIAPRKPPWEIAFMQLDALAESDLLENGEFKDYFDRLTDILREYIEGRFGIQALELSTTETMENLREADLGLDTVISARFIDTTQNLLRRADLVKFAKFLPDIETAYKDWQTIKSLIEDTIPREEEENGEQLSIPDRKDESEISTWR
ncbi:hypothetical protein DRQ33_07460 [bacterium]|nr:MAG: hypothetical protein DRQ33_07460 [bacterium]